MLDFYHCNETAEIIHLQGEEAHLPQFGRFQPMTTLPRCFEPVAGSFIVEGNGKASPLTSWLWSKER